MADITRGKIFSFPDQGNPRSSGKNRDRSQDTQRLSHKSPKNPGDPAFRPMALPRADAINCEKDKSSTFSIGDIDLSEMIARKMKEADEVKAQLAEQRTISSSLLAQLTSLQSRSAGLESLSLEQESTIQAKDLEINRLQDLLDESRTKIQAGKTMLAGLKEQVERKDGELKELREVQEEKKVLEGKLDKVKEKAKMGFEAMRVNFESLKNILETLNARYEVSTAETIPEMRRVLHGLGADVKGAEREIQPLLDPSGHQLLQANQTREVVRELQTEADNANQVITLLRDKLLTVSSQLAEANEKVQEEKTRRKEEEAERREREKGKEVDIAHITQQVQELAQKLIQREREVADKETSVTLEVELREAKNRLNTLSVRLEQKEKEREALMKETQSLSNQVQLGSQAVEGLEGRLKEVSSERSSYRHQVQVKNTELVLITEKLRVAEDAEGVLQSSARKDAAKISELENSLRLIKASEASVKTKNTEMMDEIKVLENENSKIKMACNAREGELRQMTAHHTLLQERFDSQTMALKLANEHSGSLQERILLIARLEENADAQKAEIASLQQRIAVLQDQLVKTAATSSASVVGAAVSAEHLARLKAKEEELNILQIALSQTKSDCAVLETEKMNLQKTHKGCLKEMEEVKNSLAKTKMELDSVQEQRRALENKVERLEEDFKQQTQMTIRMEGDYAKEREREQGILGGLDGLTKEFGRRFKRLEEQLSGSGARQDVDVDLDGKVHRLEAEIVRMQEREESLEKRYRNGDLNESEKEFVNSLIKFAQDLHEHEMVAKHNELRSRDNMVIALQQKVEGLELSLAKSIKSKNDNTSNSVFGTKEKSMLDLNIWMSSPLTEGDGNKVDSNATSATSAAPAPPRAAMKPPPTRQPPVAPLTTETTTMKPTGGAASFTATPETPTFAKLEEDISDFEEEVPLATKLGKRNRPGSPANSNASTSAPESGRPARRSRYGGGVRKAKNVYVKPRNRC